MQNLCRQMENCQQLEKNKFETFADIKLHFDRLDRFYAIKISSPHKKLLKLQRHSCEVKLFGYEIIEHFYLACWQLLSAIHYRICWSYNFELLNTDRIEKCGDRLYARLPPHFEVCHYEEYFIVNKRLKFNLRSMIDLLLYLATSFSFVKHFKLIN